MLKELRNRICALAAQSYPDVSPHAVAMLLASAPPAPSTAYTSTAVRSSPSTFADSARPRASTRRCRSPNTHNISTG
ncbi:hypothetical protein Taro_051069 [Colocasia esculenta]|uniref:Uncharacterized protein n=1 Tax=Colocasia esculenta TaxID=4460 RepID=A0A843XFN5_COLES|nr:hypothetical protein [Colocasia esculenta]